MSANIVRTKQGRVIEDPPIAKLLFSDTRLAWIWVVLRIIVGWSWLDAASHKLTEPGWMQTGESLLGFWQRAVAIPEQGSPAIRFDWYRSFIQGLIDSSSYVWFAKLIAIGEFLVGVGLIIGAFVGIAAFFGAVMNWNFIMAGSASSNGLLLVLAVFLVLAWKVAGYYGLDYYLLPRLGTPWTRLPREKQEAQSSQVPIRETI